MRNAKHGNGRKRRNRVKLKVKNYRILNTGIEKLDCLDTEIHNIEIIKCWANINTVLDFIVIKS